jgi:SPASM domain peptide maturase of grasp-with-spasm system
MTSPKQPFGKTIARGERRFYSLNVLLADYEPVATLERDEAILENKQPCRQYDTRDFSDHRFHKHITTPLGPIDGTAPRLDAFPDIAADRSPPPAASGVAPVAGPDPGMYFVSWACCLPVEGHARSIVCDLQRGTFAFIPNIVVDLLALCRDRTIEQLHAHYGHQYDRQIDEYLAYLIAHDFGFFSPTPQRFPPISLDWRNPRPITNCVIDFADGTDHPLAALSEQLSRLFCQAVELRFFRTVTAAELTAHLDAFTDSTIRSISVLAGDHPSLDRAGLDALLRRHKRVKHITVHSTADHDEVIRVDLHTTIRHTSEVVTSEACCGQVSPRYFSCNIETFTEALQRNSCLDRKVSIDARGAIKNCPSMPRSYGDVHRTPLAEVVSTDEFQALWKVSKDDVLVCQDCEFRYICHDCRAYLTDPEQPLSKPAKCRYDPYTCRWT